MAGYVDFLRVLKREGKPRRFTYVCGREGVLVEDVVDRIRAGVGAAPENQVTLFAGRDKGIWLEMSQRAFKPEMPRLVTVREAERLRGMDNLPAWLAGSRYSANIHVLMVSEAAEWEKGHEPDARAALMRSSQAMYVAASVPRDNVEPTIVNIIGEWGGPAIWEKVEFPKPQGRAFNDEISVYLARRTGYSLSRCRDVVTWVNALKLGKAPTKGLVDVLAEQNAQDNFVSSVLHLNKPAAFQSAADVSNVAWVVGTLARKMDDLERIHRAMVFALRRPKTEEEWKEKKENRLFKETALMSGVPFSTVSELWDAAKFYDRPSVSRRADLLCLVDERRHCDGVLEMMVALW